MTWGEAEEEAGSQEEEEAALRCGRELGNPSPVPPPPPLRQSSAPAFDPQMDFCLRTTLMGDLCFR